MLYKQKNVETMKKVRAKQTVDNNKTTEDTFNIHVIEGKIYDVYSEFETDKMFSKKCYVVLVEYGDLVGLDSDYFEEI